MFFGAIYIAIALAVFCGVMLAYNIYCFVGLIRLKKELNDDTDLENISSRFNLYIWILKKIAKKGLLKKSHKKGLKLVKRLNTFGITIFTFGLIISIIVASVLNLLNNQANNIADLVTILFGDKDCICYAKCTGNEEDDEKTAYELLFGVEEYEKFYNSIVVTPAEKQPFLDMHNNNPNGKTEGEWLIQHLDDNALQCYKAIVGNNNKFRSGDHQDRSKMTNEELRQDLIALLSDYKVGGINPDCDRCFGKTEFQLGRICLGEAHWVPGWTWEAIWGSDNPGDGSQPDPGDGTGGGGGNTAAKDSEYGIQLDDGWYYWYHQASSCMCKWNVNHATYGRYGSVLLYTPNSTLSDNFAGSRGCSTYSSALAVSNTLGMEVTPYDIILTAMGGSLTKRSDDLWQYSGGTSYIDLSVAPPSMKKTAWAQRLQECYYSEGLRTEYIGNIGGSQTKVDEILAKNGYIIASWKKDSSHSIPWYPYSGKNGSHFMVIRKKDASGYYCLNSAVSDANAYTNMTTPISWSALVNCLNNVDGIGMWDETPNTGGDEDGDTGGGTPGYGSGAGNGSGKLEKTVGGWLNLYDNTTVAGNYIKTPLSSMDGFIASKWPMAEGQGSTGSKYCRALYSDQSQSRPNGGSQGYVNSSGRYWVAVGPWVTNRSFKCGTGKGVNASDMGGPKLFDVVVKENSTGKEYYIPCVIGDAKAHTYPTGVVQTGIACGGPGIDDHPANNDHSIIEFCGLGSSALGCLKDYTIVDIYVYD